MRLKDLLTRRRPVADAIEVTPVSRLVIAPRPSAAAFADVPRPSSESVPAPRAAAARMTTAPVPRSGDAAAERAAIRAWARAQGLAVSDRGRLPAHVLEAYRKAH